MDDPVFKNPLLKELSDETKGCLLEAYELIDGDKGNREDGTVLGEVIACLRGVSTQEMG